MQELVSTLPHLDGDDTATLLARIAAAPVPRDSFEERLSAVERLFGLMRVAEGAAALAKLDAADAYHALYGEVARDGARVRELNARCGINERTQAKWNTIAEWSTVTRTLPHDSIPCATESLYELALKLKAGQERDVRQAFASEFFEPTRENIRRIGMPAEPADDEDDGGQDDGGQDDGDPTHTAAPPQPNSERVLASFANALKQPVGVTTFVNYLKRLATEDVHVSGFRVERNTDGTATVSLEQLTFRVAGTNDHDDGGGGDGGEHSAIAECSMTPTEPDSVLTPAGGYTVDRTTLAILKNFVKLNGGQLCLHAGREQRAAGPGRKGGAIAAVAELKQPWPQHTSFDNGSELVTVMSGPKAPVLTFGADSLIVTAPHGKRAQARISYSDPSHIDGRAWTKDFPRDNPAIIFRLDDLRNQVKCAERLDLDRVQVIVAEESVRMMATEPRHPNSYVHEMHTADVTRHDGSFAGNWWFRTEYMALMLGGDYSVSLAADWKYAVFTSAQFPVLYYVAFEQQDVNVDRSGDEERGSVDPVERRR